MKNQKKHLTREKSLFIFLLLIVIVILSKLFFLQIVNASELKARGATFRDNSKTMVYERGMIIDAQGNILAKSVKAKDIYADPKTLLSVLEKKSNNKKELDQNIQKIASDIAQILEKENSVIYELLTKDLSWVSLARQVDIDKANQVAELGIPGIGFTDTYKRVYPSNTMYSSILGIVNMAGDGVEGLEYYYNDELKGETEFIEGANSDDEHKKKQIGSTKSIGYNLILTIDSTVQHLVEQSLDDIVDKYIPERVVILAMEPSSGKILGMGSRPTFDPNNYINTSVNDRKNLAISMIYEPGSTFKIITGAAAIEEKIVTADQIFYDPGYYIVGSKRITNWDSYFRSYGNISFAEGMRLSSNVVLAQIANIMGKEVFYTYLKSFGFGSKTKIDIAGEEQGLLINIDKVKSLELATMSFGQANLVTPIQLLSAICAVANGGKLMQPYLLDKITTKDNYTVFQNNPKLVRQVISESTSAIMTDILVSVVDEGTGGRAKIPGIKVAGKTGTAQKIDPKTGAYSEKDFIVSFVAYAPADNPKIAVLVVIDSPRAEIIQGGTLAGPYAKNIIESTLQYYGIPVAANTQSYINNNLSKNITENKQPQDKPTIEHLEKGEVLVPDLKGLTMRQVGEELGKLDLRYNFSGTGLAVEQFPESGQIVNQGDTITVIFSDNPYED
ncbi:MAG: PASTA domain-containing protein [Peptococcaceae bacterium]|nr:PASTA domain-containing protein [Peptococcaceae bacterium]